MLYFSGNVEGRLQLVGQIAKQVHVVILHLLRVKQKITETCKTEFNFVKRGTGGFNLTSLFSIVLKLHLCNSKTLKGVILMFY